METWTLAEIADDISRLISQETARTFVAAVENDSSPAAVRLAIRRHAPTEAQPLLSQLEHDAGLARTCSALAAAVTTRSRIEAERERVEIVWTGPATIPVPSHRTTAAVAHELIASAKEHITLATYSAGNVDDFIKALDRRRRDSVEIRLLLETPKSDGTGPDCPKVFERLLPYVKALEWPRKSREDHDWTSMHVKVLIKDADAVLVTSANMSEAAMRHNMEVGVEIKGGTVAARLRRHFDELENEGVLKPLQA